MYWYYYKSKAVNDFNVLMVLVRLAFLIQPVYSGGRNQNNILDDSGNPLIIVNVRIAFPNVCNLSDFLSPPKRLPAIAGSQTLARAIVSLYYW